MKITLTELRQLVKNIIKEEFGTSESLLDLIKNGSATYYKTKEFDDTYNHLKETPQKQITKSGRGKVIFNKDISALNYYPSKNKIHGQSIKKGDFINGAFDKGGLINGDLYRESSSDAEGTDPLDPNKYINIKTVYN